MRSARTIALPLMFALAVGEGACSVIVDPSSVQCSTTADCVAKGPAFAGSFCSARRACELTCTTNANCVDANGGAPSICRADHSCAKLLSEDCKSLVADRTDLDDPNVLWLGMLLPLDDSNIPLSQAKQNAAELARRDFKIATGGLPPLTEGGARRPFAFVVCDHSVDADRAARHLANDLGVPAIIGPIHSGVLIQVATDVTIPAGVLLISPAATSPFITHLANKNGLVWRTAPSDTVQSIAIALLIESKVEPELRASVLQAGESIRLAVVHKGDAYGVGLEGALFDKVIFNGKNATDNGANYRAIDYGNPDDPNDTNPAAGYAQAVTELVAFQPHIVVIAGLTEGITGIFSPLEQAWPANAPFRPRYIMTDGLSPRPELLEAVQNNAELRRRILGTEDGTNSPLYQKFLARYASVFNDGTQAIQTTAATYDAAYLLAYATASLGTRAPTGALLNLGLQKTVPPGPRIDVGPESINDALAILATGSHIDFNGASGPLDFDVTTGEAESDVQVWCLDIDAKGYAVRFKDSGLFYDATTRALAGTLSCP